MINLIPNEQKKMMMIRFYYRLGVILLLSLSLCILIGVVVMIPAYFVVSTRENIIDKKLENQKNETVSIPDEKANILAQDLNSRLTLIEQKKDTAFLVSKRVIDSIISNKTQNIKISSFFYENNSLNGRKITIEGSAPSRESLLSFRLALENNKNFKQVDLPISNFIKGSNIKFSLTLIPS